jgi:hypothetical protein
MIAVPSRNRSIDPNTLARAQGAFYAATGVWPLVHMRSFEAVTGPKADRWLVQTVGALVGVIGGTLLRAGRRDRVTPEIALLAAGSALGLAAIDIIHTSRGRISKVYLLDAAVEIGLAAAWAGAALGERRADGPADVAGNREVHPAH